MLLEGLLKRETMPAAERAQYQRDLACPPMPAALEYLWTAFKRIRRRVGGNGFGALPIGWPDIDAFLHYSRLDLSPWEIDIIEMLDDLYLTDHSKPKTEDQ